MTIIFSQIIVLGLFLLISYLQQKAKNRANKQDLKNLTEIVESVKQKNNEEIELLRANLSSLADREKQLFDEEKQAIVVFFAQLNTWIWDSLNIYIHEYNWANYQEISSRLIAMRDTYNKVNVDFSKVRLIVSDEDLIEAGHDVIIKTLELHHFTEGLLKRLVQILSCEETLVKRELDFGTNTKIESDLYQQRMDKNNSAEQSITKEYFDKHKDIFNPAIVAVNNFKDKAKVYLRKSK